VREWLKGLSKEDCKVIGTDILTLLYEQKKPSRRRLPGFPG
jgi:hypothetical protein